MAAAAPHRIEIQRAQFKFSAAHMTVFPDGSKEHLHGHNFELLLRLELRRAALAEMCDFALLKEALREVCRTLNERVLVAERNPFLVPVLEPAAGGGEQVRLRHKSGEYLLPRADVVLLPLDNITSEQLARHCHGELSARLAASLPTAVRAVVAQLEVGVLELPGQGGFYTAPLAAAPRHRSARAASNLKKSPRKQRG